MSARELLFCNLRILGYSASVDAFDYVNVDECQNVLHFLLSTLDSKRGSSVFSSCWPILKKHDSALFRQAVLAWLDEIRSQDPPCKLPMVNMGLLVSPGGWKVYEFLFALSQHVLYQEIQKLDKFTDGVLSESEDNYFAIKQAACVEKSSFTVNQTETTSLLKKFQTFSTRLSARYRTLRLHALDCARSICEISKELEVDCMLGQQRACDGEDDEDISMLRRLYAECEAVFNDICVQLSHISSVKTECGQFSQAVRFLLAAGNSAGVSQVATEPGASDQQAANRTSPHLHSLIDDLSDSLSELRVPISRVSLCQLQALVPTLAALLSRAVSLHDSCVGVKSEVGCQLAEARRWHADLCLDQSCSRHPAVSGLLHNVLHVETDGCHHSHNNNNNSVTVALCPLNAPSQNSPAISHVHHSSALPAGELLPDAESSVTHDLCDNTGAAAVDKLEHNSNENVDAGGLDICRTDPAVSSPLKSLENMVHVSTTLNTSDLAGLEQTSTLSVADTMWLNSAEKRATWSASESILDSSDIALASISMSDLA